MQHSFDLLEELCDVGNMYIESWNIGARLIEIEQEMPCVERKELEGAIGLCELTWC
jgi:hypothetical protein